MIVGGKTHRIYARLDPSYGNPDNNEDWYEIGVIKEATFSTGRQREHIEDIGDNYARGWTEGAVQHPTAKLTYEPSGSKTFDFLKALLAFDGSNAFIKEPSPMSVEVFTEKPTFNAMALFSGLAKSTTITVQSLNSPIQIGSELHGLVIERTVSYNAPNLSKYTGFKSINVGGRVDVDKHQIEGHHIQTFIKFAGESEQRLSGNGYATNYSLTFTHELQEAIAEMVGDDSKVYSLPAEYSIEKSGIQASFSLMAKNWKWWEKAEANNDIDYLRFEFRPPSSMGLNPFYLKLKTGVVLPTDLPIKSMAALGISVNLEFIDAEIGWIV